MNKDLTTGDITYNPKTKEFSGVLFSSKKHHWETPPEIYDPLHKAFKFTLDPCAEKSTAKCKKFYTVDDDGLTQDWSKETVFVNPPYSNIKEWVKKCHDSAYDGATVVMLIPARTDTRWFHEYIYHKAEIKFLKGRIKFIIDGVRKDAAPFPSMLVIYKNMLPF